MNRLLSSIITIYLLILIPYTVTAQSTTESTTAVSMDTVSSSSSSAIEILSTISSTTGTSTIPIIPTTNKSTTDSTSSSSSSWSFGNFLLFLILLSLAICFFERTYSFCKTLYDRYRLNGFQRLSHYPTQPYTQSYSGINDSTNGNSTDIYDRDIDIELNRRQYQDTSENERL